MDDSKTKLLEACKFSMNEIVLCYEPDPLKAKMLYDAKILDVEETKDDKGKKVFEYYIHFQGWNKSWDRWILENKILKANETSRTIQTKLYDEAIRQKKRKPKSTRHHESGDEKDDKSVTSIGSGNSDELKVGQLPLVSLDIPKVLAVRLEDDCYNIKRKKKLIHLPRKPTVNDILNEYYAHCEKIVKTPEGRNMSLKAIYEIVHGLNTYFNYFLFSLLLYNFEREQYHNYFPEQCKQSPECLSPNTAPVTPKLASPNSFVAFSDSSRSNSRTSSFCEDGFNNSMPVPLLKEVLKTKPRKRRGEGKSFCLDETSVHSSTPKRKRNTLSCSTPGVSKDLSAVDGLQNQVDGKIRSRETRSARKTVPVEREGVYPKEEKAIKPMEILTENIIDMERTVTRSKAYAYKDRDRDKDKDKEKENSSNSKKSGKGVIPSSKDKSNFEKPKETKVHSKNEKVDETGEITLPTKIENHDMSLKNSINLQKEKDDQKTKESTETLVKKGSSVDEKMKSTVNSKKGNIQESKEDCVAKKYNYDQGKKARTADPKKEKYFNKNDAQVAEVTLTAKGITYDVNTDVIKALPSVCHDQLDKCESENISASKDSENESAIILKKEPVIPEKTSGVTMALEEIKETSLIHKDSKNDKKYVSDNTKVPIVTTDELKIEIKKETFDCPTESCFDTASISSMESQSNRLRRSIRAQKCSSAICETDEQETLPMGSTAKSFQELYKGPLKLSTDTLGGLQESDKRNNKTFMLYPQTSSGDTPADIYGLEHLLRLFVKLPLLLTTSNIEERKIHVILKYTSQFLDYLSKRTDLFVESTIVYSESII